MADLSQARSLAAQAAAGVRSVSGLTKAQASFITFEPSIAILAARVDHLEMDIRSFRVPLTRAVREVMVPSIRKNFNSSGRPTWAGLAPDTERLKSFYGYSAEPLMRTGSLARVASQMNIWTINEKAAVIKDLPDSVYYGKVHQAGYTGGGSKKVSSKFAARQAKIKNMLMTGNQMKEPRRSPDIPARPFLIIQAEDQVAIEKVFEDWLMERLIVDWGRSGRL